MDAMPAEALPMPPYCDENGMRRIAELEAALRRAAPYVVAFAENAPDDDGGAEAKLDLLHVRAALNEK